MLVCVCRWSAGKNFPHDSDNLVIMLLLVMTFIELLSLLTNHKALSINKQLQQQVARSQAKWL